MTLKLEDIQKIDSQKMYSTYDIWPIIASDSYFSDLRSLNVDDFDSIYIVGMGGSGSVSDVIASIFSKSNIPVYVVKGYNLPNTFNSKSLLIAISASGNTLETLSIMDSAKNKTSKIIAFSCNGKMKEYCNKHEIEHRYIQMQNSPRASFPYFLYGCIKVLEDIMPIKKNDILESINTLKKTQQNISSSNLSDSNQSLNLAKWLSPITMIYYPSGLSATAIRFKNSLQENAKSHVMAEDIVEACHNGVVAWEKKSIVKPVLIQGVDDFIKTKELWIVFEKYLVENHIDYKKICSVSGNILSKLVNLIYILDYATIYNAILHKIDPTPIKSIDFIKSNMT